MIASPLSSAKGAYTGEVLAGQGGDPQESKTVKLSLADLEEMLGNLANKVLDEDDILRWVRERGVDFYADPANLDLLKKNGATGRIVNMIVERAPKRVITGTLTVRCAPGECEIKRDHQTAGTTKNGQLVLPSLPVGRTTIDFERDGYIPQQVTVEIAAGGASEAAVTLEPNGATQAANGRRLLELMLSALGLDSGAKELPPLSGSGSLTSYADGKQTDWNFDVGIGTSTMLEMKAESSAGNLIYQCNGQKCGQRRKGHFALRGSKVVQPAVAATLETNLRAFAQNHIGAVLQNLLSPEARVSARTAYENPQLDQKLRAELPDSVYSVTLGTELVPAVVEYESKAGLGSGLRILFGDYRNIMGVEKSKDGVVARYPRHTVIRLPDGEKHGVEVKLDKVEAWPAFKAGDFGK